MADKLKKQSEPAAPTGAGIAEAVYTADEFAGNAVHLFGARANADLVSAAFKVAGRQEATLSEARGIVDAFMTREVK